MKCALVALVGVPNVGKSTLLNALVGEKVGIVSAKPNTTRVTVRGVRTEGDTQLIFMDTPGLNRSGKAFDRRLVQHAQGAGNEADILVFMAEARSAEVLTRSREVLERQFGGLLGGAGRPRLVVALTKVDLVKDKKALLPLLGEVGSWCGGAVDAVVPVSGMKGIGVDGLVKELVRMAPEGVWLFPAGQVTDMPLPLRLAEITREKAMRLLHEEVPYGVGVITEGIEQRDAEGEEAPVLVNQQVLVAKEQHKAMVVGKGGQMLRTIGMQARKEMQEVLGQGVRLELHVKVAERWAEREEWLREMGV